MTRFPRPHGWLQWVAVAAAVLCLAVGIAAVVMLTGGPGDVSHPDVEFTAPPTSTQAQNTPQPKKPSDPGFRWQLTDVSGKPSIAVYTSLDRAGEAGAADLVEGTLADIARTWPDRTYQLLLNPGSPIAVVLPAEAVPLVAEPDQA